MNPAPLKILADRIAPMQWDLIQEAIAQCNGATVVAEGVRPSDLASAISQHDPDVLILGDSGTKNRFELVDTWMMSALRQRRILTLFDGPATMSLTEWRLSHQSLTDLTLGALCDAIEGRT